MLKKLPLALILLASNAFSESETIPYELNDGDVISASVINDILRKIELGTNGFIKPEEMVGTNKCTAFSVKQKGFPDDVDPNKITTRGNLISTPNNIIVTENKDEGTYTMRFSSFNPYEESEKTKEYEFEVTGSYFFIITSESEADDLFITKTAANGFNIRFRSEHVCETERLVPNIPTELAATVGNNNNVSFEWTDNSNNETAFDLVIIDSDENETVIETTSADTNTTVVTMDTDGQFELRVKAKNNAGESLGSNAVIVTVEDGVAEVF